MGAGEGSPRSDCVCRGERLATYYVYIMTNRTRRLYFGVTNDLHRRVYEHKHRLVPGFSSKYFLERLGVLRGHRRRWRRHYPREGTQRLAPLEENRPDTESQSPMVRPEP